MKLKSLRCDRCSKTTKRYQYSSSSYKHDYHDIERMEKWEEIRGKHYCEQCKKRGLIMISDKVHKQLIDDFTEFEVLRIEYRQLGSGRKYLCIVENNRPTRHVNAQSMERFAGYVYEYIAEYKVSNRCTQRDGHGNIKHPIAVLIQK